MFLRFHKSRLIFVVLCIVRAKNHFCPCRAIYTHMHDIVHVHCIRTQSRNAKLYNFFIYGLP
jgi:hypothetical protein